MKQGNAFVNFAMVLLTVAVACYLGIYVLDSLNTPYSTAYAYAYAIADSIETDGWLIREEQPLDTYSGIMDLTREEVRAYIADRINAIIRSHEIDYVKWDYNRDITEGYSLAQPPHRQKEFMHRQILGTYDLCHRIVEGNPDVMFEGCASGGSRYDAGMLYYFPQVWVSDMTDAPARARIQYGASLCYPLSTMSCHVTPSPNLRATHFVTMQARADIAHLGATGYELDTTKLSAEDLGKVPLQVASYHADEKLVLEGDLYRLVAPVEGSNHFAVMLVSKDKKQAKLTAMRFVAGESICLHPRGLAEDVTYTVPELNKTLTGREWTEQGIAPSFAPGDNETCTFHFEAK